MNNNKSISKPHYSDHRTRLRNRFLELGINSMQPYEIIELFLTFVIPQKDVKPAAKQAVDRFETIKGFFDASENDLKQIPFFKDKAIALRKFIKEIALLYRKEQAEQEPVSISRDNLVSYCINKLGYNENEEFWMISLNSKQAIIKEDFISKGLQDKTPVYPRIIIETALKNAASSLLLLHNHTNNNPKATEQDIALTKAIEIPARLLNITIFDHLIVAGDNYFSFRDNKIL